MLWFCLNKVFFDVLLFSNLPVSTNRYGKVGFSKFIYYQNNLGSGNENYVTKMLPGPFVAVYCMLVLNILPFLRKITCMPLLSRTGPGCIQVKLNLENEPPRDEMFILPHCMAISIQLIFWIYLICTITMRSLLGLKLARKTFFIIKMPARKY